MQKCIYFLSYIIQTSMISPIVDLSFENLTEDYLKRYIYL